MAVWASAYMKPIIDNKQKGTLTEPSKHVPFNTIFYGFTEITNTFDALKLSGTLISVAPPRSKKVNSDEYMKYLVNTYLQDMYILKERLNTYATKIKRMHNKAGRKSLSDQFIEPLFANVKSSFDGIVNTRGMHVHSTRYSDDALDDVTQMALISKYYSSFILHYNYSYKKAQKTWASRIANNNDDTKKILDHYFSEIIKVVKVKDSVFMP
jgi:hypothetical protein